MPQTIDILNARDLLTGRPMALRLRDGQIEYAGDPTDWPATKGQRIDAAGRWLSAGFCDSHLHLFWGGVTLNQLNLLDVHDRDSAARAITAFAATRPEGEVICAYSANYDLLGPGTRPDRRALDTLLPDRPLLVRAVDGHAAWANTVALRLAGLMDHVPALRGAEVVLDADGRPNGELREGAAIEPVTRLTANAGRELLGIGGVEPETPPDPDQRARDKATLATAMAACAAFGITTAVNMDGNLYQADLLTEMAQAGELPIRVVLPMTLAPDHDDARIDRLIAAAGRAPVGKLSFGWIKMFMDGVFDTWTAFRTDDYPGRPGVRSAPLFAPARFAEICRKADAAGLQIEVHCVGDGAVRATLDGYAAARAANGPRDARHRIEHIDMLHPDDLARIKALGVVASMQPVHPPGSSGLPLEPTISIMGRHRWADTFPWAALAAAGVPLAFGTDWPTAPLSPLNAIHAALSRQPWAAEMPDQRLPFAEVIAAYTRGGAYPLFEETRRGTLAPGQAADVILLEGDPRALATAPEACRVVLTLCDGVILRTELPQC